MIRHLILPIVMVTLVGCTMTAQDKVATVAQQVGQICAAAPAVLNAVGAPDPTSSSGVLLAYATAACNADGTVASTLAPNLTSSTPAWLQDVLNGLAVAAKVAPIVLPLLE